MHSAVLHMLTHMNTSYLDKRIHLHLLKFCIVNLHVVAVPMYQRHTAQVIFDTTARALDVPCPSWRNIVIGVSTDGETKMKELIAAVLTRFQNVTKPEFIRIWCGDHQIDLVI